MSARGEALSTRTFRAGLAAIFALAWILRVLCVLQYERGHPLAQRPVIDEASYEGWAREIASGDLVGEGIFFQEPLYPYALGAVYAVAGDDLATQRSAARHAQALAGAAAAVLASLLGKRLFGARAGLVAGAALALYRPAVWMPCLLLKENLFLALFPLFALALLDTRRPRRRRGRLGAWALAGLLAGLGALLRGNVLILLPFLALWPLARALARRESRRAAVLSGAAFLTGAVLALAPVAARNYAVGGRFVLTTSGAGTNVYGGNNPENPYGVAKEFSWVRGVPEHEEGDWRHEAERRLSRKLDAAETSSFWLRETLRSVRERPGLHLSILWNKLRLTLGSYEVPDNHFLEWDARHVPLLRWPLPGFGILGLASLAGLLAFLLLAARRRAELAETGPAFEVAALLALYLGTIVLTVTSERVRLALVPLLLPFAAWSLRALFAPGEARALRLTALAAASAVAAWLVLAPVLPRAERAEDFDERDFNLAVGLIREQESLAEAEALARALHAKHPSSPRVLTMVAEVEYRRAREVLDRSPIEPAERGREPAERARALALAETALERLGSAARSGTPRERFDALTLRGAIRQFFGQWAEAEADFRGALEFDPEEADLRHRLAVTVAEQAMQAPPGAARSARLREAERILLETLEPGRAPRSEELLAKIRAQL